MKPLVFVIFFALSFLYCDLFGSPFPPFVTRVIHAHETKQANREL